MSAWPSVSSHGKAALKIVPPYLRIPQWKGPGADSEEKREPASDIDTAPVNSLKVLDPGWPIREADIKRTSPRTEFDPLRTSAAEKGVSCWHPPIGGWDALAIAFVHSEQFRSVCKTRRRSLWQAECAMDRLWEGEVQHEASRGPRCSAAPRRRSAGCVFKSSLHAGATD